MIKQNILVVAAHPDDEVLGCGGTIARLAEEGHNVYITILGEGITSRFKGPEKVDNEMIKMLHKQSHQVADILGAKDIFLYSQPDNCFDVVPLLEIINIVENLIVKLKPKIIYTHYAGDLNIDHKITHRAVVTATRPTENCPVKEIYTFEIPSSTEWAFGQFQEIFNPNMFVNINETLDIKIKAMEKYKSEICDFPHPRSFQALKALAQYRGSVVGLKYAEAFETIRKIV